MHVNCYSRYGIQMPRSSRRKISRPATRRSTPQSNDHATDTLATASLQELSALPAKTLRQHLAVRNMATSGVKATLARRLFTAIHGDGSATVSSTNPPTHPTQNTLADNATTLQSSQANPLPTSCTSSQPTEAVGSGNITPAQVSSILQFLSQALQSSASQQPPSTANFSHPINGAPPIFSTAQQHSRPVTITTQSAPDPPSNTLQVLNDDALSTASVPYHLILVLLKLILQTQCYCNLSHQFLWQCSNVS